MLADGWSPILPQAELCRHCDPNTPQGAVLLGVKIVELSDGGDCVVRGLGRLLADLGATVVKAVSSQQATPTETQLAPQLDFGKARTSPLFLDQAHGVAELHDLLSDADGFITNLSERCLEGLDLNPDTVISKHSRLVYFQVSNPWSEHCAALGMFATSGVASVLAGGGTAGSPPIIPTECASLLCAMYALAAVSVGLFHQCRTGQGQRVVLNLEGVGAFLNQLITAMCWKDRDKLVLVKVPHSEFAQIFPIPTFASFQTKDGVWVQLLGVDLPRHLPKLLRALGVQLKVYPRAVCTLAKSMICNAKNRNFFEKMFPVFRVLNSAISSAILDKTWDELHHIFLEHDVWHNMVRTPQQLHHYEQAHIAGGFVWDNTTGSRLVASPVFVWLVAD